VLGATSVDAVVVELLLVAQPAALPLLLLALLLALGGSNTFNVDPWKRS
tara:strand:+ start:282 stop:428 length:147 start_codon:yes stop_codon:yes gene_type:complete